MVCVIFQGLISSPIQNFKEILYYFSGEKKSINIKQEKLLAKINKYEYIAHTLSAFLLSYLA